MTGLRSLRCSECGAQQPTGEAQATDCYVCGAKLPAPPTLDTHDGQGSAGPPAAGRLLGQLGKIPDGREDVDLSDLLADEAPAQPQHLARIALKSSLAIPSGQTPSIDQRQSEVGQRSDAELEKSRSAYSPASAEPMSEVRPDAEPVRLSSSFTKNMLDDAPLSLRSQGEQGSYARLNDREPFQESASSQPLKSSDGTDADSQKVAATLFGVGLDDPDDPGQTRQSQDQPGATTWRVRNAKGVVYEFASREAVTSWIKQRSDSVSLEVAEGEGPFEPAEKLGFARAQASLSSTIKSASHAQLPIESRSEAVDWALGQGDELVLDRQRMADPSPALGQPLPLPEQPERVAGMRGGAVAKTLPAAFRVAFALLVLGTGLGLWMAEMPSVNLGVFGKAGRATANNPPAVPEKLSAQRQRALQDLESGNYTAAVIRLERVWQAEKDPELLKHHALALYRSDRLDEAVETLREFQAQMAAKALP